MPIVRINRELIFFAHVPKCAGTSIEEYLRDRFGPLAFFDWKYDRIPPRLRWTETSPQHIDAETFFRLVPRSFLAATFTMVRHPLPRMKSVFHYQQEVRKKIAPETGFTQWLETLWHQWDSEPFAQDNHPRPMCDFVPDDATVFKLEDGTQPLIDWLDTLAGNTGQPRAIPRENVRKEKTAAGDVEGRPKKPKFGEDEMWLVSELYAKDFQRFGYRRFHMPD